MIETIFLLFLVSWHGHHPPQDSYQCDTLGKDQAREGLQARGGMICFVLDETTSHPTGTLSSPPRLITIYAVSRESGTVEIGTLPYPGSTGKVEDAFLLDVDGDHKEDLVVIHSADAPSTWEIAGRLYDVRVFSGLANGFEENANLSRLFGLGGDQLDDSGSTVYEYPYKDRSPIEKAKDSEIRKLLDSKRVAAVAQKKLFFHRAASAHLRSRSYVVPGDVVFVTDMTAGWCKATYKSKRRSTTGWLDCSSIEFK